MAQSPKLPDRPVYKMFFDGRQTRQIMKWLQRMEGDLGGIDLNNPELQAILVGFSGRITSLETTISSLPDIQAIINRVTAVEGITATQTTQISGMLTDITNIMNRLTALESATPVTPGDPAALAALTARVTALETRIQELFDLITALDIQPIPNSEIAALFA